VVIMGATCGCHGCAAKSAAGRVEIHQIHDHPASSAARQAVHAELHRSRRHRAGGQFLALNGAGSGGDLDIRWCWRSPFSVMWLFYIDLHRFPPARSSSRSACLWDDAIIAWR